MIKTLKSLATVDAAKDWLQAYLKGKPFGQTFGFDLYIPGIIASAWEPGEVSHAGRGKKEIGALLMDAAWELCLEGTLRPGARTHDAQIIGDAVGNGFSIINKG